MVSIPCNSCKAVLPQWELKAAESVTCPDCGTHQTVRLFPAAFRTTAIARPEAAAEGDATCFDHPSNRAVASCAHCGRFVCALCETDLGGKIYCPSCVAAGRTDTVSQTPVSRFSYDSMALLIAVGPLLFWPALILTAPLAIYISVRYWRRPLSALHRNRWRFAAAILIALAEIIGMLLLIAWLITYRPAVTGT